MRYAADNIRYSVTGTLEEVAAMAVSETRRQGLLPCPESENLSFPGGRPEWVSIRPKFR
jgi:hypothetical protein